MDKMTVMAMCTTDKPEILARASEAFARAAAGLAMEGVAAVVMFTEDIPMGGD